jgi:hypothetical protein
MFSALDNLIKTNTYFRIAQQHICEGRVVALDNLVHVFPLLGAPGVLDIVCAYMATSFVIRQ